MKHPIRVAMIGLVAVAAVFVGMYGYYRVVSSQNESDGVKPAVSSSVDSSQSSKDQSSSSDNSAAKRAEIQKTLQAYLNTVGKDQTVSVTFKSLAPKANSQAAKNAVYSSGSINASVNGDVLETSASTYKLFIAAYLFGTGYSWSDSAKDGFDNMVVHSANDFAEGILSTYGNAAVNSYLTSQGWNNVFDESRAAATTSNNLADVLTHLQAGTGAFADKSLQQWLLGDMAKQVYRDGIPAAAGKGAVVQDKVGFLDDVNNDAAIVTMPDGQRFILVIMTHGHNQATLDFSRINTVAKRVLAIVTNA